MPRSETVQTSGNEPRALDCEGYRSLLAAVERNEQRHDGFHDYRGKLKWVLDRAQHYAEKTGLSAESILDAWEKDRSYWYMNYYQACNQPKIEDETVRVFETTADLLASIGQPNFRCPNCSGVSTSPYACTSGVKVDGQVCDWKVYGLFGDLGKGIAVFVKERVKVEKLFMPLAWEKEAQNG